MATTTPFNCTNPYTNSFNTTPYGPSTTPFNSIPTSIYNTLPTSVFNTIPTGNIPFGGSFSPINTINPFASVAGFNTFSPWNTIQSLSQFGLPFNTLGLPFNTINPFTSYPTGIYSPMLNTVNPFLNTINPFINSFNPFFNSFNPFTSFNTLTSPTGYSTPLSPSTLPYGSTLGSQGVNGQYVNGQYPQNTFNGQFSPWNSIPQTSFNSLSTTPFGWLNPTFQPWTSQPWNTQPWNGQPWNVQSPISPVGQYVSSVTTQGENTHSCGFSVTRDAA